MLRKIIRIDEEKCNGCGLCIPNCAEGAIQIIDGKARLVSDAHCDGLGACLGHCPMDALSIEERDADAFDEEVVKETLAQSAPEKPVHHGCPGSMMRQIAPKVAAPSEEAMPSHLGQWPVQLKLVQPMAPFLKNADLVICADCVPFAVADFHRRYLLGRAVVVGCPKLDDIGYYREKLEVIFREAAPKRVTVLRMEVPCCGGLSSIAMEAHQKAIPNVPLEVHTIGIEGGIKRQTLNV